MNVKFKVTDKKADGTADKCAKNEPVAPYNLFFYTMWSELEIEFNSELVGLFFYFYFFLLFLNIKFFQIENTKFNYQLQTYLKILLNSTEAMRNSILQNALYYKDLAGALDLVHRANESLSPGNYKRADKIKESK